MVLALDNSSGRIESLVGEHGITLSFEANHQNGWEGVGKLQDTQGSDECGEQGDLRDGGGDDKGEDPVNWHKENPYPLAPLRLETWEFEKVGADVIVDDLYANVAVKTSRNDAGDQLENISHSLPVVGVDTLVRRVVHILTL
jgi:hypothetical protein